MLDKMEIGKPVSFLDTVGLPQEEFELLLLGLCVKRYICLFVCLFIYFRRMKVISFAMKKIAYVPVADDLMQDGVLV